MRPATIVRLLLASLLVVGTGCRSGSGPSRAPATMRVRASQADQLRRDLQYLASDKLEGRGIGSRGLDLAADYIAARFASLRLRPLPGQNGYFQTFTMSPAISVDPASSLRAGQTRFDLGSQFSPLGFSGEGKFSGPLVFAGYGISSAEHHYDDYAGIGVRGKVVLVLRFEPHNEKGASRFVAGDWSPAATLSAKADAAAAHGAAAILLVNPPRFHGADRLVPVSRSGPKSKIPYIHIRQQTADELLKLAGCDKSLESLQTRIDTTGQPHSLELAGVTVCGAAALQRRKTEAKNVLAYLPGGAHPDEFIVVGAHYDHLGRGGWARPGRSTDDIHNGADDNASGTAAVMHLAERLVRAGRRDRSILFILFTGEESDLLGSTHFVDHPPVRLDKIVAMINLDMVGRVQNQTLYVGGTGTADAFDAIVKAADDDSPLQLQSMGKGGLAPSDSMPFARKKIPVLFLYSGMHAEYHTPADEADKINYDGIEQVVDLTHKLVDALATMPPQQYVGKYDSRFAGITLTITAGSRAARGAASEQRPAPTTQTSPATSPAVRR